MLCLLALNAALACAEPPIVELPQPPAPSPGAASPSGGPLTWAPPAGWEAYVPVTVPAAGGILTLPRNDTDYRVFAPEIVRGAVTLRGGRNVVWIGGHIRIDRDDAANGAVIPAPARRGVMIDDGPGPGVVDGRVVFVEGLRLDGDDLSEGFDTKAPSADVYLQNIGIDTVRHRGFDDRDSTGAYAVNQPILSHADLIENFGGSRSLNVDGLSGRTNYQGLFLSTHGAPVYGSGGDIRLRRIDMTAVELADEAGGLRHAGHRGITWYGDQVGQIAIDGATVWFQHHPNSGWGDTGGLRRVAYRDEAGVVHREPVSGDSTFVDNFGAGPTFPTTLRQGPYGPVLGQDATGVHVTWPEEATLDDGRPAVRDWTGTAPGRVYSGAPPGGPYVPLDSVGLAYQSPGYRPG